MADRLFGFYSIRPEYNYRYRLSGKGMVKYTKKPSREIAVYHHSLSRTTDRRAVRHTRLRYVWEKIQMKNGQKLSVLTARS
jgi:hypothetical protein